MNPSSQLFDRPPRWQRASHRGDLHIPADVHSWLFEPGSLTRRLKALCGHRFHVRVLNQSWQKPWAEEARLLGIRPGQRAIVREVALQQDGEPLVMARSIIPLETLHGTDRRLAHLGARPLGQIIFASPRRLRRLKLELAVTRALHWKPGLAGTDSQTRIWGRRSLYSLGPGHVLLVAEHFLPRLIPPGTARKPAHPNPETDTNP